MKRTITFLSLLWAVMSSLADNIQIGDLYYTFSGTQATVTYKYQGSYYDCWGQCYRNYSYTIPETVTYLGQVYDVKRIGDRAFGNISPELHGAYFGKIHLAESIETICNYAFYNCKNLTEIIIPQNVSNMGISENGMWHTNVFEGCNNLRKIFYTSSTPPNGWVASDITYVPNKKIYGNPTYTINNPSIIEMITFAENEFIYSGQAPTTSYTNNVEGYDVSLSMPTLKIDVGNHEELIPVTFTKEGEEPAQLQ